MERVVDERPTDNHLEGGSIAPVWSVADEVVERVDIGSTDRIQEECLAAL